MKNLPTFEAFLNESINEGDMTNYYDGFVVLDYKTKKSYKFKYVKGSSNVKVEDEAISKLMASTKSPRPNFAVHGFVKKGEWNKSEFEVLESSINEGASFSKGNKFKHITLKDIFGTVAEGPLEYKTLQSKGFDKDEDADDIEDASRRSLAKSSSKVWYGVELKGDNEGSKLIMHEDDIKKG